MAYNKNRGGRKHLWPCWLRESVQKSHLTEQITFQSCLANCKPVPRAHCWWRTRLPALTTAGALFLQGWPRRAALYLQPLQREGVGTSSPGVSWGSCSSVSKVTHQAKREGNGSSLFKVCSRIGLCRGSDGRRGQTLLFDLGFASFLVWGSSVVPGNITCGAQQLCNIVWGKSKKCIKRKQEMGWEFGEV